MSRLKGRNYVDLQLATVIGEKNNTIKPARLNKYSKLVNANKRTWIELTCIECGCINKRSVAIFRKYYEGKRERYLCKSCTIAGKDEVQDAINALNIRKARAKGLIH